MLSLFSNNSKKNIRPPLYNDSSRITSGTHSVQQQHQENIRPPLYSESSWKHQAASVQQQQQENIKPPLYNDSSWKTSGSFCLETTAVKLQVALYSRQQQTNRLPLYVLYCKVITAEGYQASICLVTSALEHPAASVSTAARDHQAVFVQHQQQDNNRPPLYNNNSSSTSGCFYKKILTGRCYKTTIAG